MAQRPVYIDVYTEMLRDIQTGLYPENSLFPPEEKLCRKYNASRSTLRRALNMLKETGVLYSVQGNGTYIKPFVFTQPYLISTRLLIRLKQQYSNSEFCHSL